MFEWEEYLDLARELAAHTDNEAALRSALSRAYYAVFGIAYMRLIDTGWTLPQGGSVHQQVWGAYRGSADSRRKEIGERGFNLRDARNFADYRQLFPGSLVLETARGLRSATVLIALLEQTTGSS